MMRFGTAISFSWYLAMLVLLLVDAAPAVACTRPIWNRPYDPATATLVAEGWIERVVARTDLPPDDWSSFTPLDVVVRAEAAYKGLVPSTFIFRESASYKILHDKYGFLWGSIWDGSSGACGLFDDDPTGLYVLVVLMKSGDGDEPDILQSVGIGRDPHDYRVGRLRDEIRAAPPPSEQPQIISGPSSLLVGWRGLPTWIVPPVPLPTRQGMLTVTALVLIPLSVVRTLKRRSR